MTGPRVAVLNGFGISLGDSIIGLQALAAAQSLGMFPRPTLCREMPGGLMVDQLYALASSLADILPLGDMHLARFDQVIDIRDFAFDPGFRGVAMIDFFLEKLGIVAASIPPAMRRNAWLGDRFRPRPPKNLSPGYALVCPNSSMALRDLPEFIHAKILRRLRAAGDFRIVSQRHIDGPGCGVTIAPPLTRFDDLCGLVAGAFCVIATDTAMVHLADAFAVPCLALFTTHRPEWRVRDYPHCTPFHLPVSGFPDALEFSRGSADLKAAHANWEMSSPQVEAAINAFMESLRESGAFSNV